MGVVLGWGIDLNLIISQINNIDWKNVPVTYNWSTETFGNAEKTAVDLCNLFSGNMDLAMDATHSLWCSLCHQHSHISSVALLAYDFIVKGLDELNDALKIEILDIILGFAVCTSDIYYKNTKREPLTWEIELKKKLVGDIQKFKVLSLSENQDISFFAGEIVLCINE